MKRTTGILVCILAAGLAWAQNPQIIQNTRTTMNTVQQKSTAASNEALGIKTADKKPAETTPATKVSAAKAPAAKTAATKPAQTSITAQAKPSVPATVKPAASTKPTVSVKPAVSTKPVVAAKPAVSTKPTTAKETVSVKPVKASTEQKAAKKAEAAAKPKAATVAAVPATKSESSSSSTESARSSDSDDKDKEKDTQDKKWSMTGKRDPFISPVVSHAGGSGCSTGKKCLEIGAINLRGVVRSDAGFIAVVTNSLNKAYFLRENDPVFDGYVVKITGDSIVFQETMQDRLGKTFTREVVKKISTPAV